MPLKEAYDCYYTTLSLRRRWRLRRRGEEGAKFELFPRRWLQYATCNWVQKSTNTLLLKQIVFQNAAYIQYTGTWGQQRYMRFHFCFTNREIFGEIRTDSTGKGRGEVFRSPYQATPTTPVFPNSLHGRRRRVVYLHFLPPPCRVFFPRRQSHSQSAAAAAAFLRFGKVFPPFPYFFRGKPKHAIVIINFGFEWQVLCIACMDLSCTKKKYSFPSPYSPFCFIFKGFPCSKWVFSFEMKCRDQTCLKLPEVFMPSVFFYFNCEKKLALCSLTQEAKKRKWM